MFFRCLLGGWNRANNLILKLEHAVAFIYLSYEQKSTSEWTTTKALIVIICILLLIQPELHKLSIYSTSHHMEGQVSPYQLNYPKQCLRKNCDTSLFSCWGAEPEAGEQQAAAFWSDHASRSTAYDIGSAWHPGSGLGCVLRKCSHGKWELELFPSGSIRTVGE